MGKSKNRPLVFINFRGKDERQGLVPHLKQHLKDRNVNVFTDEDAPGEPLENLFKHIRRSRIVIVIFSINYLQSEWCLEELVHIRECLKTEKLDFAIPIFYKVKTSHVKQQSGKFGKKFVALQKKHPNSRVKRWKKALRYVANSIGLTYKKRSSISELDFIKMVVEKVDLTLTKIASKDNNNYNNNSPETSKGESSNLTVFHHTNNMLDSSTTLEALKLEKSYRQGFLVGAAWKDVVMSSIPSSSSSFRIPHPANSLQFRGYNWGVDSRPFLSPNFSPFVEVPTCYRLLEPKVPQDYRRSIAYHNNLNQYYPWPYETGFDQYPIGYHRLCKGYGEPMCHLDYRAPMCDLDSGTDMESEEECSIPYQPSMHDHILSTSHDAEEREDKTSCISLLCYYFKRCFSLTWEAKDDDED